MTPRSSAICAGSTRYFTGIPCKRGHVVERMVSTRACVACLKLHKLASHDQEHDNARRRRLYPKNRDKILQRNSSWKRANPLKSLQIKRRWAASNPEKVKDGKRRWVKDNPEKAREWFRRRHARLKGAKGSHTAQEVQALIVAQDYRCNNPLCGADLRIVKRHLDHIRPLTPIDGGDPGSNDVSNLQWLCWPCNASKGSLDWDQWLAGYAKITRDRIP